jgi:class 3 adenylate cyclase/pimeloyl-ACP methyl ester carboxylesterase
MGRTSQIEHSVVNTLAGVAPPIRFALTEDDVSIAYSVHGDGPPLVFVRGWISHLDLQWLFPDYRMFMEALGRHFTVIRYDMRGNGLSERKVTERLTLDDLALDLHAVIAAAGVYSAPFIATCYGGPIVARFARQSPASVEKLVLDCTYARGEDLGTDDMRESVLSNVKLLRTQPGMASMMLGYYTDPDKKERTDQRDHFARDSINADVASELYALSFNLDATKDYINLDMPTLVTHRREAKAVPVEHGRRVAALVPDATFIAQEGRNTNPWDHDATGVLKAVGDFLGAPLADGYFPRVNVRPTVILFSDMVDSTQTTSSLGDNAAQEINRAFHNISRECLEVRGGRLVKRMGDGLMAEFPSVSQAVGCAIDMQTTFQGFSTENPERPVNVRIGINAGEPVSEDDDLHGLVISTAARICDQGLSGEILVSNVVRELGVGKGFSFVDRGRVPLKGIAEPVKLFRVEYYERSGTQS